MLGFSWQIWAQSFVDEERRNCTPVISKSGEILQTTHFSNPIETWSLAFACNALRPTQDIGEVGIPVQRICDQGFVFNLNASVAKP